ncbi:MAG: N-6 DNA methylase [Methanoregula sp.]
MKGFVPTPSNIVDLMVVKLFSNKIPQAGDIILDPGCGTGAFIDGIIRWCQKRKIGIPQIIGVDSDPRHIAIAFEKYRSYPTVQIRKEDFLTSFSEKCDFIVGNPPYVPITGLNVPEKDQYRKLFTTATGRFDLYFLFYEQALKCLKKNGKLVFITPEKYLYVKSATALRILLWKHPVTEIHLLPEQTFGKLTTYPTVTTLHNGSSGKFTKIILRNGECKKVRLAHDGSSQLPVIYGANDKKSGYCTLNDLCLRVSCGVATGSDEVFVRKINEIRYDLKKFAYPTIAGKQLSDTDTDLFTDEAMILPYNSEGRLIPENELGTLGNFLQTPGNHSRLLKRTCVVRKPWYAFHETPPLQQILQPKIICKDITGNPFFRVDATGELIPRHSVYYIIPKEHEHLYLLNQYLNSDEVRYWLKANCHRAANGFLRLQSSVLKKIPIPLSIFKEQSICKGQGSISLYQKESSGKITG